MTPQKKKRDSTRGDSPVLVIVVVGAIVLAGIGLGIALLGGGSGDDQPTAAEGDDAFGNVNVVGTPLPAFEDTEGDAAIGQIAPQIVGQTPSGAGSAAGGRGAPTLVAFLAHWCPHCQRELPLLVDLQDGGDLDGFRTTAVATGTDPNAPNYPPGAWLVREGWTGNLLLDDQQGAAASAYGLSGYPFLVFLNTNGEVVARTSGELTADEVRGYLDEARQP